ncbi:hypothetical protein Q0812_10425 [Brevundimonas sp. 2R-24]|uniref:Uncharacterized protein n=1 Tax=Peiella sedimenti TaxID=3061083 RepID=A0ABT8SMN8_9CAUL|nr:hypothetical protein [Caulobacteraceae bacterium XZ-24]
MSLRFTGASGSSPAFELLLEAYDGEKRVMVITTREAIDDHGLAAVQHRASEKYAAKQLEGDGRVRVFTTDL